MIRVDVRDLAGKAGASRTLSLRTEVGGLRTELAGVPEDEPLALELRLESVVAGILVSGTLSGRVRSSCARCLAPSSDDLRVEVAELFASGSDDDRYPLEDDAIDLEPMVRDAVVLSLPFSPLCRLDCLGLCERCGGDRNLGECACPARVDPRWAALETLELH